MRSLLVFAISAATVVLVSTFASAQSGSVSIQWGDHPAPPPVPPPLPAPPPAVIEVYPHPGGPPPHAPAHGYRGKHQYRYYPYRNVYYEPVQKLYFYMSGNGWAFGASLPGNMTVSSLGTYVSIGLDTDHPYYYNDEHVRHYPREKYRHHREDDGDDDDNWKGHGKGKGKKD